MNQLLQVVTFVNPIDCDFNSLVNGSKNRFVEEATITPNLTVFTFTPGISTGLWLSSRTSKTWPWRVSG